MLILHVFDLTIFVIYAQAEKADLEKQKSIKKNNMVKSLSKRFH